MPKLHVEGLPVGDSGRLLVRLNHAQRKGVARYGIVQLSNNSNRKSVHVLLLGHDRNDAIFMPFDIRTALGVDKGSEIDFSIKKVGWIGKLYWYIRSPDPAVHVPAWIAVVGLILAVVALGIGILSLLRS